MSKSIYRHFFESVFILLLFFFFSGCTETPAKPSLEKQSYLFLGHAYDWLAPDKIDPRLYCIDFEQFLGVWLGGDVCSKTSETPNALPHLDSIFDLSAPSTLWAIGNHDIGEKDVSEIEKYTRRPSFYTKNIDNICVVVLNTNLFWHQSWAPPQENCEEKIAQEQFFKNVLDTLQFASHLVVLHHHSLFNELKTDKNGEFLEKGNINPRSIRINCDSTSSLTKEFYPQLTAVQQRNIQVVLVGGDYGMQSKTFEYKTPEGITFLGSGINNSMDMNYPPDYVSSFAPDSVLIFSNDPQTATFDWQFIRLSDLVYAHQKDTTTFSDRVDFLLKKY